MNATVTSSAELHATVANAKSADMTCAIQLQRPGDGIEYLDRGVQEPHNRQNLCVGNKESACAKGPIDDSPEGMNKDASRLHLPRPKRKLVSPSKKHEVTKFARRRQTKRWSSLEEDSLRTAVQEYGKGNWKLILNSYRDIFEERTEVDLKDKWRNMSRN